MQISQKEAVERLIEGKLVALPTETVYGLAARFDDLAAVEQIFKVKGRPKVNPLIIHIDEEYDLDTLVQGYPEGAFELMHTFWPGPLTLLLPVKEGAVLPLVNAGLPQIALRCPLLELTRSIIRQTGPLVMPSANLSGRPSSTTAEHVERDFGDQIPVLNGGSCNHGMESTVVAYSQGRWHIARQGAITSEQLADALSDLFESGRQLEYRQEQPPICPGQLLRHYSPKAQLILCKEPENIPQNSCVVGFEGSVYPPGCRLYSLGSGKAIEAARLLYAALRSLDDAGAAYAYVDMSFEDAGLWRVVRERLERASGF